MKWLFYALYGFGGLASLAWFGAKEPLQTRKQKRAYGLIAIGCWLLLLVLGNTVLS
jgi:hypothetical protein